MELVCIQA